MLCALLYRVVLCDGFVDGVRHRAARDGRAGHGFDLAVRRRLILHKRDALFRRSLLKLIRKGSLFRVRAKTRCFAVLQNDNAGARRFYPS